MAMDENSCFDNADMLEGSSAPMDQTLAQFAWNNGRNHRRMYCECKRRIVEPCNITSSKS
jgi:hypothetical protein